MVIAFGFANELFMKTWGIDERIKRYLVHFTNALKNEINHFILEFHRGVKLNFFLIIQLHNMTMITSTL